MFNKFYYVLFLFLISIVLLNSQESYNKYYYKSLISSEDMRNGIFNNQTESEQKWVKEWKQQLKNKANSFKDRTGFDGDINFHNDRASIKRIKGNLECPIVTDSITAISSANQILDDIIDLLNMPRNQLQRSNIRYSKSTYRSGWVVNFQQFINDFRVKGGGLTIRFNDSGVFNICNSVCYPDLSTDTYPQFTKIQIEEIIRKEHDLSDEITFNSGQYYFKVGKLGNLSLHYETYYSNFDKMVYHPSYKVMFNALTGEIEYHSNSGIP